MREGEEASTPPAPTQTIVVSLGTGSWRSLCQWSNWDSLFLLQAMGIQASSGQRFMAVLKITAQERSKAKEKPHNCLCSQMGKRLMAPQLRNCQNYPTFPPPPESFQGYAKALSHVFSILIAHHYFLLGINCPFFKMSPF